MLKDHSSLEQEVPGYSWVLLRMRTRKGSWDSCLTIIGLTEKEQAKLQIHGIVGVGRELWRSGSPTEGKWMSVAAQASSPVEMQQNRQTLGFQISQTLF